VSTKPQEAKQKFSPWDGLEEDGEVWMKSNDFNDTTTCKTYAIISPSKNTYRSVNTYNDIAKGDREYQIKDIKALQRKLDRKHYEKLDRS